ncbi:hypothetical protein ACUODJ_54270, partial [Escherichia sp. HC-CC]
LAGLPLLLIAGLIHWRLGWLKAYQQKLASAVGSLRNDSQLNTPKAILIDLIRALPVCLIILAVGLILLIRFQPAQTPVDQPGNQQQRQTSE